MYMQIGIRELRAGLAGAVRRAGAGTSMVVTVDGRPVARLGPLSPDARPGLDDLVAAGLVVAPHRSRRPAATVEVPVDVDPMRALRDIR